MKKMLLLSLAASFLMPVVAEEFDEELPPIMAQSYLGEKEIDDTARYAESNAQGVLRQLEELQHVVRDVKKDFKKGELGDRVQADQKEIIEVLSEIIEKNRPRTSKPPEDQEQSSKKKAEAEGQQPGQKPGPQEGKSAKGLEETIFRRGTTTAGALRKYIEDSRKAWGRLPPTERTRLTQEMKKKLPKNHSEWIEEFTKAMSSGTGE